MHSATGSAATAHDETCLFGSFHLAGFELAVPIGSLQEVVPLPATLTAVPLAPPHVHGLFSLRGMLIPIVNLARFIGLEAEAAGSGGRIAVISAGGARLGLLFDATGEMIRLPARSIIPFNYDGGSPGLIESAFQLESGDRILQVLSIEALGRLPGLPKALNPDLAAQAKARRAAMGRRYQAVSFSAGGRSMALEMNAIHEILRVPELEHSVLADDCCLGRVQLRGLPVPIVDFARYLGLRGSPLGSADADVEDLRRVLVLRHDGSHLGLLVDEVESIVHFLDEQLLPMPALAGNSGVFAGCVNRREHGQPDLLLLDARRLHADPPLARLAKDHQDLYRTVEQASSGNAGGKGASETWVTFELDRLMGLRIEQLCEVLDNDPALVCPPGSPAYVRGVLNLRGQLVTVIDPRVLYGLGPAPAVESSKILVLESQRGKIGLRVDAVRNIVSIDRCSKIRVPRPIANQLDPELRQDLLEVVDLPDHTTIMLLDARPLVERLGAAPAREAIAAGQ